MTDFSWDRGFALEQAGDDEEMLAELLNLLWQTSVADLERIKEGLGRGNPKAAGQAAHSIKGAAASLGMQSLSSLAYEMEKAGLAGDLGTIGTRLADLEQMIRQLEAFKSANS